MSRPSTLLTLLACFAAAFLVVHPTPARGATPSAAPERQILVMVRQPPEHYRLGGVYGGGYGDGLARSARSRLGRRIARDHGLIFLEDWPMPMIGVDCLVMAVPDGQSTAAAAEAVSHDSAVSWAQPVEVYRAQGEPASHNDPLYPAQPAAKEWRLAEIHQFATGRGVRVAIIDSGIEATHPDLSGRIELSRNFVAGRKPATEMHGTGVAGIIVAKADNGLGIAGVAPDAHVLGLRACWQAQASDPATLCDSFSVAKALYFAIANNPDVINLSLSGADDKLIRQLLDAGLRRKIAIVAAVDAKRGDGGFPASAPGVIAVSDVALAGLRNRVYTAPGRDVPTTEPGGRWFLVSGSSYAAAHVSGLLALIREEQRSGPPTLVRKSSRDGAIDACASVLRVARRCDCRCAPAGAPAIRLAR